MATTLISKKKSTYSGPNAYYTFKVEETARTSTTVTLKFTASGYLQYSSSWLGSGLVLKAGVYVGGAWKTWTLKSSSTTWSGTTSHSKSASFTFSVSESATSITISKVRVLRTDSYGDAAQLNSTTPTTTKLSIANSAKFTISFNGNATGVTNVPAAVKKQYNVALTLPSTVPKRPSIETDDSTISYTFNGWSTSKTASSGIKQGGTLDKSINSNTTLYATWKSSETLNQYTLDYDCTGGTLNGLSHHTKYVQIGSSTTILGAPIKANYNFGGWYTGVGGTGTKITANSTYTPTSDMTLYAHWLPYEHAINFNINGGLGSIPSNLTKTYGSFISIPEEPTPYKIGYFFECWNTNPDGSGINYYPGDQYVHDQNGGTITLYAIYWEKSVIFFNTSYKCKALDFHEYLEPGILIDNAATVFSKEFIEGENGFQLNENYLKCYSLQEGDI